MTLYLGIAVFGISVVALIYLFLIAPRLSNSADMELLKVDYAHRGLWTQRYPENSLAAFELAARGGFGIELDVRLTKDLKIVVFHDNDLKRMCGIDKRVDELTLAELKGLRLLGTNQQIPTLWEVLRLVDGRVPLLIEIKGEKPQKALCHGVSYMLDHYEGSFCIESFSPLILRWFKRYRPSYARGQLVTKITEHTMPWSRTVNFILSRMLTNFLSRPDFVAINGRLRRSLCFNICTRAFHTVGFVWTVRSQKEHDSCRRAGLNVIFEKYLPKG